MTYVYQRRGTGFTASHIHESTPSSAADGVAVSARRTHQSDFSEQLTECDNRLFNRIRHNPQRPAQLSAASFCHLPELLPATPPDRRGREGCARSPPLITS